jgi:hypothetical protein
LRYKNTNNFSARQTTFEFTFLSFYIGIKQNINYL